MFFQDINCLLHLLMALQTTISMTLAVLLSLPSNVLLCNRVVLYCDLLHTNERPRGERAWLCFTTSVIFVGEVYLVYCETVDRILAQTFVPTLKKTC